MGKLNLKKKKKENWVKYPKESRGEIPRTLGWEGIFNMSPKPNKIVRYGEFHEIKENFQWTQSMKKWKLKRRRLYSNHLAVTGLTIKKE